MDTRQLCLKIEQATKSLTPLSVSVVQTEGRAGTFRIVAEAFAGMKLPERINTTLDLIETHDESVLKKYDLAFELLSPAEDALWNEESNKDHSSTSKSSGVAAKDIGL